MVSEAAAPWTARDDKHEVLTGVGPGTPMGKLFRRFWLPALLASELPEADGVPVRLRILCEDLLAFRDSEGRIGVVDAYCPHKLAPLFFGRNENCGIRCVYHGWKFNIRGECVDIPNIVPPDTYEQLKRRASIKAYPAREAGGMVWIYMGPPKMMPELPGMEWFDVAEDRRHVGRWLHRSNWLQAMEGEIDTSHISFLHSVVDTDPNFPDRLRLARDGAPQITLKETNYGYYYGARRNLDDQYYWRLTQWMLPMWSAIAPPVEDFVGNGRAWVPIDDSHTMAFCYRFRPHRAFSQSEIDDLDAGGLFPPRTERRPYRLPQGTIIDTFVPTACLENDFLIDRDVQRNSTFTGIWGINEQDRALQESMPSLPGRPGVVDRSNEHLVKSDLPAVAARRILMRLAKIAEADGDLSAAMEPRQYAVRAAAVVTSIGDFDEFMAQYGHLGFPHTPVPGHSTAAPASAAAAAPSA